MEEKGYTDIQIAEYDFEKEWKTEAESETNRAITAKKALEKYTFKDSIWRAVKGHLFDLFQGKCAYCEAAVEAVLDACMLAERGE